MATLTRDGVCNRALEALGVKAASESAASDDLTRAEESFDTVYDQIRKEGLAPFVNSAVPEWAQSAMIHLIALDLSATFGISGELMSAIGTLAQKGRMDLATQVAATRQPVPIRVDFY